MASAKPITIDKETDDLLSQIAKSGDVFAPELLRKLIPDRQEFVRFLQIHRLTGDQSAQSILKQFDASTQVKKSPMTKVGLARSMAEPLGLTMKQAAAFLDVLAQTAINETRKKGVFVFPGIGRLVMADRVARMGRNPQTGAPIKIKAKKVVKFRVASSAKDAIAPLTHSHSRPMSQSQSLARRKSQSKVRSRRKAQM